VFEGGHAGAQSGRGERRLRLRGSSHALLKCVGGRAIGREGGREGGRREGGRGGRERWRETGWGAEGG